jgi:hypothetical protein
MAPPIGAEAQGHRPRPALRASSQADTIDGPQGSLDVSALVCSRHVSVIINGPPTSGLAGNAGVELGCGVAVNSDHPEAALEENGSACLTATSVSVAGFDSDNCVSPEPEIFAPAYGDPLSSLEPPAFGGCGNPPPQPRQNGGPTRPSCGEVRTGDCRRGGRARCAAWGFGDLGRSADALRQLADEACTCLRPDAFPQRGTSCAA